MRGKLKKEFNLKKDKLYFTDFAAVGDVADYDLNEDGTGVINSIEERRNYISRKAPRTKGASYRGERLEQVIAANIDKVFIVTSVSEPAFNNRVLDRFLVSAESSNLDVVIVINKLDLDIDNSSQQWQKLYNDIGYTLLLTSAVSNINIDKIKSQLNGNKSLFWGQSGVGKSTILNKMFPGLNLKIGNVSKHTSKGIHTTVTNRMISLNKNTFVIDTPGIREIDPYGIKKEDLSHYFIEFEEFADQCKFNTCTHHHEPCCEVIAAAGKGLVSSERYDSYLRILETIEDDLNF
ncbi:MAG: ribosome small subunit-dependent GTPase A [Ignavibacteriaceae bacterium]